MGLSGAYKLSCQSIFIIVVCSCFLLIVITANYEHNFWVFPNPRSAMHVPRPTTAALVLLSASRMIASVHIKATSTPLLQSTSSLPNTSLFNNITVQSSKSCSPRQRIVFLKTHKTASTTVASIFERYGYYRNLTFAIGNNSHVLSYANLFNRQNVLNFPGMNNKTFNILTNHARYNRPEMDVVVPGATYITIIRRPDDQIASAFGYFEMYRGMKLGNEQNPLKTFMEDPKKYYKNHSYHMWQMSRNGMLFDLGFDRKYEGDREKVLKKILQLQEEFDLVLLAEYFDESLVLLRKMLCWEFEDILYVPKGVRSTSHRYEKDDALRKKLRAWSQGDMLLYEYFNKTFWDKVHNYGPMFKDDVARFRAMNKAVFDRCVNAGKMDGRDRREEKYTLKNISEECTGLLRSDVDYTPLIRKSMVSRFGAKNDHLGRSGTLSSWVEYLSLRTVASEIVSRFSCLIRK